MATAVSGAADAVGKLRVRTAVATIREDERFRSRRPSQHIRANSLNVPAAEGQLSEIEYLPNPPGATSGPFKVLEYFADNSKSMHGPT